MIRKFLSNIAFFLIVLVIFIAIHFLLAELWPPRTQVKATTEQADILAGRPSE